MTEEPFRPAYLSLAGSSIFEEKIRKSFELMRSCTLCGRACGVNRLKGEKGFCNLTKELAVESFHPHHGEEEPISGIEGSGTIFFSSCNLGCVFCQNYRISRRNPRAFNSSRDVASMMLKLQRMRCHNINLVTPTHQMPMLLEAILLAAEQGLNIPIVWNCGGYESLEALEILDGIVDIHMPDFKFMDEDLSEKYLQARDYPGTAMRAIREMHRQVGDLTLDSKGVAKRGVLIRHLVMPGNLAGTDRFLQWVAEEISPDTYVNIMDQYHPAGEAEEYAELDRRITPEEYRQALESARKFNLRIL